MKPSEFLARNTEICQGFKDIMLSRTPHVSTTQGLLFAENSFYIILTDILIISMIMTHGSTKIKKE